MFKLVISDADGTLIYREKLMDPAGFARMLEHLSSDGIPFAVASGRTVPALRRLFRPYENRLILLGLDGACAYAGGQLLFGFPVEPSLLPDILRQAKNMPGIRGVEFCAGEHTNLYTRDDSLILSERQRIGDELLLPSADSLPAEPVYKIIYLTRHGKGLVSLPDTLHCVYRSETVTEAVRSDVDKLRAAETLCGALDIPLEEVLAYGDAENDRTVLEHAGTAVTMYGAKHDLFSVTTHHTGNVPESVLSFLREQEAEENKKTNHKRY